MSEKRDFPTTLYAPLKPSLVDENTLAEKLAISEVSSDLPVNTSSYLKIETPPNGPLIVSRIDVDDGTGIQKKEQFFQDPFGLMRRTIRYAYLGNDQNGVQAEGYDGVPSDRQSAVQALETKLQNMLAPKPDASNQSPSLSEYTP